MKTDLAKALTDIEALTNSLMEDASQIGEANEQVSTDPKDKQAREQRAEYGRQLSLIGHSITGLRGVSENLNGLMPKPAAKVEKKTEKAAKQTA